MAIGRQLFYSWKSTVFFLTACFAGLSSEVTSVLYFSGGCWAILVHVTNSTATAAACDTHELTDEARMMLSSRERSSIRLQRRDALCISLFNDNGSEMLVGFYTSDCCGRRSIRLLDFMRRVRRPSELQRIDVIRTKDHAAASESFFSGFCGHVLRVSMKSRGITACVYFERSRSVHVAASVHELAHRAGA